MKNSIENEHRTLKVVSNEPVVDETLAHVDERPLGLTWLDKDAAHLAFVESDAHEQLVRLVGDSATALAGSDRDSARIRLLSRAIAITRAQGEQIEGALGQAIAQRDERMIKALDRVATGCTGRLVKLIAQHQSACESQRRPIVCAVGYADHVEIRGE